MSFSRVGHGGGFSEAVKRALAEVEGRIPTCARAQLLVRRETKAQQVSRASVVEARELRQLAPKLSSSVFRVDYQP